MTVADVPLCVIAWFCSETVTDFFPFNMVIRKKKSATVTEQNLAMARREKSATVDVTEQDSALTQREHPATVK